MHKCKFEFYIYVNAGGFSYRLKTQSLAEKFMCVLVCVLGV